MKYVYAFGGGTADGDGTMKDTLGGKGAGLAEMSRAGVPVPPGFTIITDVCNVFFDNDQKVPKEVDDQIWEALAKLEKQMGKKLGDASDPLLLSVRSGAKFSMPGMMNTILNLGLNDETTEGLVAKTQNPRFAYDCYRRFIQMFGEVAMNIDMEQFDEAFDARKHKAKVKLDTELSAEDLKAVIAEYKKIFKKAIKRDFPQDVREQLILARNAVFNSWWAPKASYYRKMEKISDRLGTACNIQIDGVRQHGRHLLHGRRLHARSRFGREGVLRRVPGERAGRGRGVRRSHAAAHQRVEGLERGRLQPALRDHAAAREALQGHAGLRVHGAGRHAVHAADPQRQAHGSGGGPRRGRDV